MAIQVDWFEPEKQTVCVSIPDTYTWTELFTAIDASSALVDSVEYPVYVLVDMRYSQYIPPLSLSNLQRMATLRSKPNGIAVVILGARSYVQASFTVFSRIYPAVARCYRFVRTLDDFNLLRKNEKAQ